MKTLLAPAAIAVGLAGCTFSQVVAELDRIVTQVIAAVVETCNGAYIPTFQTVAAIIQREGALVDIGGIAERICDQLTDDDPAAVVNGVAIAGEVVGAP